MQQEPHTSTNQQDKIRQARVLQAQSILFLERLWPAALSALGVLAVFTLAALLDLWLYIPGILHYLLLAGFAGVLTYTLVRDLKDLEWPDRKEALARLEADSAFQHAPLQSLEDTPFKRADTQNPLWQAHQVRMEKLAGSTSLGKSKAKTVEARDPYSLRYGVILLLVFAVFAAWGDMGPRFWRAFSPQFANTAPVSVDLWIDPPAYTGKAPITLMQSATPPEGTLQQFSIPSGSVIHTRISGIESKRRAKLLQKTGTTKKRVALSNAGLSLTGELVLTENSIIELQLKGRKTSWPLTVTPDLPPVVIFREAPASTSDNRLRLEIETTDDYGITEAYAVIKLDADQARPVDTPALKPAALAEVDRIELGTIAGRESSRTFELDLTDHRWAGLSVLVRLEVTDGAGQKAETLNETVELPVREFFNPLAQAVIYERRNLAVAPTNWPAVSRAFDALTFAPERFYNDPKDYLLLRAAYWDVTTNQGEDISRTVADLWPLALQLEDQSLELARRALDAAEEALRDALERGAAASEVASLVEELRRAMRNYIQALAESGQATAEEGETSEELEAKDLNEMLDSINDLSQSGANNAARQALSELEQMLSNLKISGGSQGNNGAGSSGSSGGTSGQASSDGSQQGSGQGQDGQGNQAMNATGELIGRQRELADETFDALRNDFGLEGTGRAPRSVQDIKKDQDQLASDLEDVLKQFEGVEAGSEEGAQIMRDFNEALDNMQQASKALDADNPNAAGVLQEEALSALRKGAAGIASEIQKSQEELAEGSSGSEEGNEGEAVQAGDPAAVDPLGRPYGTLPGNAIGIPDLSSPERARELVKELRRRLSEPGRSKEEIEYLERLLQRF